MTFEKVKTITLTLLVLLSLFLTWRLWSFQPKYDLLKHNEEDYIENNPLNEVRTLPEVIFPEQFVFHYDYEMTIAEPKDAIARELYTETLNSKIDQIELFDGIFDSFVDDQSVEMIFPASINYDIVLSLFQVEDAPNYRLNGIDRMILFPDHEQEVIRIRFISMEEQRYIESRTSLSYSNFIDNYLNKGKQLSQATYITIDQYESNQEKRIYIQKNEVVRDRLTYTIYPVSVEVFINLLFTDPLSVKFFRQTDGEETYTDGNRMISLIRNGDFMDYINPTYTDNNDRNNRHIIMSGYDFINGHGGWTDIYQLASWTSSSLKDEVRFRLMVEGMPVIMMDDGNQLDLSISRVGSQISRYTRPLFELDQKPINATEQVTLLSGEEIIQYLELQENFDKALLEKLMVGYEMKKQNAIVTFTPHWYMLYGGKWQKVLNE